MPTLLTQRQLQALLEDLRGVQIVTLIARTDGRLKKEDAAGNRCPFAGPVHKVCRVNGIIGGWDYGSAVRRQQLREMTAPEGSAERFCGPPMFRPGPRAWGRRIRGTPFVEYRGTLYLEVKVQRRIEERYVDAAGSELSPEQVAPFLPARKPATDLQGVALEVELRDYKLESIEFLAMGGQTYGVERAAAAEPAGSHS